VDGHQGAQRGTELALSIPKDQGDAAKIILGYLREAVPDAVFFGIQGCLAPGHRVLTADLEWTPVEKLAVGDGLLAISESRSYWEPATVTAHLPVKKECVEVRLDSGETFVATADHPFLTYQHKTCRRWVRADQLVPGRAKLVRLMHMWDALTSRDAGYVAGFFDSEGSLDYGPGHGLIRISAAQRPNEVIAAVRQELERQHFVLSRGYAHYKNSDCENYALLGGSHEALRFLGTFRPPRLLGRFSGPSRLGRQRAAGAATVATVRHVGEREVVGLSTSSGTYIADGFGHHNTEYHDERAGQSADAVAEALHFQKYSGAGTGRYSREVLDLDVDGVILNFSHGIGTSSGLYRTTAVDREAVWSALSGKDGKALRADCLVRSHAHYYTHIEHASKHAFITPCFQLQTRFMRRGSVYRMLPDIGAAMIHVDGEAKKRGDDPIRVSKKLFPLPKMRPTKL